MAAGPHPHFVRGEFLCDAVHLFVRLGQHPLSTPHALTSPTNLPLRPGANQRALQRHLSHGMQIIGTLTAYSGLCTQIAPQKPRVESALFHEDLPDCTHGESPVENLLSHLLLFVTGNALMTTRRGMRHKTNCVTNYGYYG